MTLDVDAAAGLTPVQGVTARAPRSAEARVVHVVGRVTDAVFSFLGPTTAALAEGGVEQVVILIDDPALRRLLPRFHATVRLVLTPARFGPLGQLRALVRALRTAGADARASAVHLHGVLPGLAALITGRARQLGSATVYFSPHGSRALGPMRLAVGTVLRSLGQVRRSTIPRAIASNAADARKLTLVTDAPVTLLECPVPHCFFEAGRSESGRPLIVTAGRATAPQSAALVAQFAVLLSEESLNLNFRWIGSVDAESAARLQAADVAIADLHEDSERAAALAAGWLYLAPGDAHGFPVFLAEAMAVGLPCVAWDTPAHRDLIRHGQTGLLCRNERELLDCIVQLVRSQDLRQSLGFAARLEALRRFDPDHFRRSLLQAYNVTID